MDVSKGIEPYAKKFFTRYPGTELSSLAFPIMTNEKLNTKLINAAVAFQKRESN